MNKYIFFIQWTEKSDYNPKRDIEYGKFIKVYTESLEQAYTKIHSWAKDTKYHKAHIKHHEQFKDIETIKD